MPLSLSWCAPAMMGTRRKLLPHGIVREELYVCDDVAADLVDLAGRERAARHAERLVTSAGVSSGCTSPARSL